ncbi:MAG: lipopolysaccharide kinase InaA family protein [Phycisphaerae bacterium]|nr:lipopolysaccharide kinase InaA family protein [Phycisphaerae bacterium]
MADSAGRQSDTLHTVVRDGVRWTATDAGRELLARAGELIARALAGQGGPPVKANPLRRVYRLDEQNAFLKRFDESSLSSRLKRLVRGPAAAVEWSQLCRAESAGVAVPRPLAVGVAPGESILITESCLPGVGLNSYLDANGFTHAAREAMIDLLVPAYQAGLLHDDLHPGNILFSDMPDHPRRMCLLDLQKSRFRDSLSTRDIIDNLAPLMAGLSSWLSAEELDDLLRAYFERHPLAGVDPDDFGVAVLAAAVEHDDRLLRSRQRAILRTGKYFARVRLPGGWRGHVFLRRRRQWADPASAAINATFSPADWQAALADVRALIDRPTGEGERVYKDSPSTQVVRRQIQVGPHRLDVFVKRYPFRWRLAAVVECLRRSRAKRAFRAGHALLMRGLPTVLPLACLERRVGGVLVESVLITESAADALPLHRFVREQLPGQPPAVRRSLADRLGAAMATLRSAGFVHRDLKTSNVLVRDAGGRADLLLIDLDGLRRIGVTDVRAVRRLAEGVRGLPNLTRTDRVRVLRSFLGPVGDWRGLWRRVAGQVGSRGR